MSVSSILTLDTLNGGRADILDNLFPHKISPQEAAEALAAICISDGKLEGRVECTWSAILLCARSLPQQQERLVELLFCISRPPPPIDKAGKPLEVHGMRLWEEMPMFAWEARSHWDAPMQLRDEPPMETIDRAQAVKNFVNVNAFLARLERTAIPGRSSQLLALWIMRGALEHPGLEGPYYSPLHFFLPAAVV